MAVLAAVLISALCIRNAWFDHLCMMMRRDERYELDEYVGSGFVFLAITVIMFIRREWQLRVRMATLGAREQSAHQAARRDFLTGLSNRLALMERMNDVSRLEIVFLLIDLDGFKAINDLHGHAAGDTVLKVASQRLQALAQETRGSFVARLGGDEFGFLLVCSSDEEALAVQKQIVRVLEEPVRLGASTVTVGASVGRAATTEGHLSSDELLQLADTSMYLEKISRAAERRWQAARPVSSAETTDRDSRMAGLKRHEIMELLRESLTLSFPLLEVDDFDALLRKLDTVETNSQKAR